MKHVVTIAAAASLFLTGSLAAQEGSQELPAQPTKSQEQTPGLQQTPDGQSMKTAGQKSKPMLETLAGPAISTSTGPTFPDASPAK